MVLNFSALDPDEHDGDVGSFQVQFSGIDADEVSWETPPQHMLSDEHNFGFTIVPSGVWNFGIANSLVIAWAAVPPVDFRTPGTQTYFSMNTFGNVDYDTNIRARIPIKYSSRESVITINPVYDTFVAAPSVGGARRDYTI